MKDQNVPKLLAEEAWRMIPDTCKSSMAGIKDSYIESLTEDIRYAIDNITDKFAKEFAEWAIAKNMGVNKFTLYEGELEIYKKEKNEN
ncbi:hypothetical protein N9795_00615 [Candidatus Pelagibacter sp.]|nr:hypothetical protein [Candidatus Pelagibacter sp.]